MFLTDFQSISMTMIKTGLIGLTISAVLYAVFAVLTRKRFTAPIRTHVLRYIFLTYLLCVLMLTLAPQSDGRLDAKANLIPFFSVIYALKSGFPTAQYLIILNIFMFVPMGIFLPCVFKITDKLYRTVLISFVTTLTIEILQVLLPGRAFDIDDILLNTLGAAVGYALRAMYIWIFKKSEQKIITRIASLLTLAVIPVFLLVFSLVEGTKEFEYGFNLYVGGPDDVEIHYTGELPDTADIYVQSDYDPQAELQKVMKTFDIDGEPVEDESCITVCDGEKKLSIAKWRNSWDCELRNPIKKEIDMKEEGLEECAKSSLQKYGLWRESAFLSNIDDTYADLSGNYPEGIGMDIDPVTGEAILPNGVIVSGKVVSFAIDKPISYWTASVFFDSEGVRQISYIDMPFEHYCKVDLISPEEALKALTLTDRYYMNFDDGEKPIIQPEKMIVDQISLTYTDGNDLKYKLPAWKLEGKFFGDCICDDGTTESGSARGYMIIEAIKQ